VPTPSPSPPPSPVTSELIWRTSTRYDLFSCLPSFCINISLSYHRFREPADIDTSGPAQEPPAPDTVAVEATSQLPAEAPVAESPASVLPSEVEAGEPDSRRSPQPDTSLPANPAPDVVPEAVAQGASESAGASHVSPRRLPVWNVEPPSPDSVPEVAPSGSEGESLPSSDAGTALVVPSPQVGVIQPARLQLGPPGSSTPRAGDSAPTPDSYEADDVEAFHAEVESLKTRYTVCHLSGVPSLLTPSRSDSFLAETCPICSCQGSRTSAGDRGIYPSPVITR